jgi:site-specific DNA-methyltransferase (adenine-specific)
MALKYIQQGLADAAKLADQFLWLYTQNQVKAMGMDHFINRLEVSEMEKEYLKKKLRGRKTPQIKTCHEPIVMAQKPYEGTFLRNHLDHGVGLVNTNPKIGENMFPSNVITCDDIDEVICRYFLIGKPDKAEKGEYNTHKTVKPLALCEYLIALVTQEN